MGATSIHVQAVKPGSEIHNFREKELDYVRPELSHLNEAGLEIASPIGWRVRNRDISIRLGRRCRLKQHHTGGGNSNQARNHHAGTPAIRCGLQGTFRY